MERVHKFVGKIIEEKGLNMSAISKAVGRNGTYIQQFVRYGTPVTLPEVVRHKLARELGVPEKLLRAGSVVTSYDPDAPDDPHDSEGEPNGDHFPSDGIRELASKGGMGSGQTLTSVSVIKGNEVVQRDAILDDYWRLPPDFVRDRLNSSVSNLLVINCQGDSMEPTLSHGDRVIVDVSDKKPTGDRLFAIRDELGDIFVKRLLLTGRDPIRIIVHSDNAKVPPREEAFEDVYVLGRVVAGLKLF